MSTTLDDLLNFMKSDKEERIKERESDKQELRQLIKGVKAEVEAAIEPLKEKQAELEGVQTDMQKDLSKLVSEMRDMQKQLANHTENSNSQESIQVSSYAQAAKVGADICSYKNVVDEGIEDVEKKNDKKIERILSLGRRTVGLQKIDKSDLLRMRQPQFGGAKSEEEEKVLAVQEFLKYEMKFDREELEEMEVERIFFPAKKKDPHYLYVTFRYERSVRMIYQRTRCMRKESRILIYIPREFHDRYDDLAGYEYKIRKFENYQTRIKWGYEDLELYKRYRGADEWERVALPEGLQKVNINPRNSISLSPAQGRPGQTLGRGEKRDRGSPGETSAQAKQKSLRHDEEIE